VVLRCFQWSAGLNWVCFPLRSLRLCASHEGPYLSASFRRNSSAKIS
jgi:hypothetical protein